MYSILFSLLTFVHAYDAPESFNHVKFEFFYKAQFIPEEESVRPRLPMNSLEPVIIPNAEYNLIQRANIEQGDLDYLIWFFSYREYNDLEAMAWHRQLLQPKQFNVRNLVMFREAAANIMPEPRYDLMLLADRSISKLERLYCLQHDLSDDESSSDDVFL